MTRRAPARDVAHFTKPGYRAGNSPRGRRRAVALGFEWIDHDLQRTRDYIFLDAHWPRPARDKFLPRRDRRTLASMTWGEVSLLRSPEGYAIGTMAAALKDAASLGLNVEIEIKIPDLFDVEAYRELARMAEAAYGADWAEHVWIKTLTSLGGYRAARRRLWAAHRAGFTTLLLVRGAARLRRRFPRHIDFVRGSRRRTFI